MAERPRDHPKGMAAIRVDGVIYTVNRYGVVFAPSTPDVLDGWKKVRFAEGEALAKVREVIRPAYRRSEGMDYIYDVREMRRLAAHIDSSGSEEK